MPASARASLNGFYIEHFRWLLAEGGSSAGISEMDRKLEQVDKRLPQHLQPHADLILRLCSIPGIDFTTAAVIVAEIGFNMGRFPDALTLQTRRECVRATTKVRASDSLVPRAKATDICAGTATSDHAQPESVHDSALS